MLSEEEAKERLEDADENNDGSITWEEYVSDAYGMDDSDESNYIEGENAQVTNFSEHYHLKNNKNLSN